ncbi:hypothetical protein [Streptomyces sp. WELS2]|uniref:hypothetical protein n=1 Tax=Streptomyces sp. WELS2 TaxID=2749435 RepID=UPI0015F0A575|nr:hypothetical protein [Streptomyces sp. WELS2]
MTKRNLLAVAALCATAAMTLTACGGDDEKADGKEKGTSASASATTKPFEGLTGDQISEKARVAMTKLKTFKIKGDMTVDGADMSIDFAVAVKGDCQGTLVRDGGSAQILKSGGVMYMKGDEKFWQQTGKEDGSSPDEAKAFTQLVKGRWFKLGSGAEAEEEFPFCDAGVMFEKDKDDARLTRGPETEVDGTRAVTLTGKDGAEKQTLLVAAEGEPYALKMTTEGGKEPGSLQYSEFNKPVTVKAPPADQVIDANQLKG